MLVKRCSEPWLSEIIGNNKTFEGRLRKGIWKSVKVSDTITFYSDELECTVKVTDIYDYSNFGEAYKVHGEALLPGVSSKKEAEEVYNNIYTKEDTKRYGVIVFGVAILPNSTVIQRSSFGDE